MKVYEIIAISLIFIFFIVLISTYAYKKKNNKPIGECACCQKRMNKCLSKIKKELELEKN